MKEINENFFKSFTLNKFLKPNRLKSLNSNRQSLNKVFFSKWSCIYIYKKKFLKTNKIPSDRLIPLFMTNLESIDINDKFDYEVALNFSKKIIYK